MSDTFFLIVGIIIAVLGGLIFASALTNTASCSLKVRARVVRVDFDSTRHLRGTYPHYPVVTYTVDGKEYTAKSSTSTRISSKYNVGQEVTIRCNPKNPKEIQVGIGLSSYIAGAVMLLFGGALIAVYIAYCI